MKRTAITTYVRARIERLVDEIVERIAGRIESQIDDVLDVARSALESDLDVAQTGRSSGLDIGEMFAKPRPGAKAAGFRWPLKPPPQNQIAQVLGPEIDAALTPPNLHRKPKVMRCRKCGAVGFTAQGCGKTHNVSTVPPIAPATAASGLEGARVAPSSIPDDEDDVDDESEKTESPPPCYARRPVRRDRGCRRAAPRRGAAGAAVHLQHLGAA